MQLSCYINILMRTWRDFHIKPIDMSWFPSKTYWYVIFLSHSENSAVRLCTSWCKITGWVMKYVNYSDFCFQHTQGNNEIRVNNDCNLDFRTFLSDIFGICKWLLREQRYFEVLTVSVLSIVMLSVKLIYFNNLHIFNYIVLEWI